MSHTLLVITNVADLASARSIASHLVEQRLAACVNILPEVQSFYRWQGSIEAATEATLFIKTTRGRYDALEHAIKTVHPYQVPELIALEVGDGLPAYLDWVAQEVKK